MNTKFNVIFAEDDEFTRGPVTGFLKRHPFIDKVDSVVDGLQALNKFKLNQKYDLLITDIRMPKIDGLELIDKIKEIDKNIFVIVLTAYNHLEYLETAANSGIDAYLVKPISISELSNKIDELFNLKTQNNAELQLLISKSRDDVVFNTVSNISHHWRQPLSIISLEAQMLVHNKKLGIINDDELIKSLELIATTSHKLSHNVDELYNNTLKDNQSFKLNTEKFINDIINDFSKLFELEHIELNVDIHDEMDININSDYLKIVIKDLILNSLEQINIKKIENPKLNIDLEIIKENLIIYIEDNALGIDNSIIDKIFEPHFTTKKDLGHLGLGLYFSKNILTKNLNGKIDIENTSDGVRFSVLVPIT